MLITLPFIYFTTLLLFFLIKDKGFNVGTSIILIYAISSFFAILINIFDLYGMNGVCNKFEIDFTSVIVYCSLLTITFIPFYKFQSNFIKEITLSKPKLFDFVSYVFFFVAFITIVTIFKDLNKIFNESDFGAIREDFYDSMLDEGKRLSAIEYIPYIFIRYWPLALLFYFYSITFLDKPNWFNLGLFISSLMPVMISILQAGRFAVIYWIMMFFLFYVLFKPHLNKETRRKISLPLMIFGGLILIYFAAVTIARFNTSDLGNENGIINSLTTYIGQPFINFSNIFQNFNNESITIGRILPITSNYILNLNFSNWDYIFEQNERSGIALNVFYTFIGEVYVDLGSSGLLIYVFSFMTISLLALKRKNDSVDIGTLILFVTLVRIPYQGIFALIYISTVDSYYIIGSIFLYFIFKYHIIYESK